MFAITAWKNGHSAAIAEQLGVTYVHRITPDSVGSFTSDVDLKSIAGDGRREQVVYRPIVWPGMVVALGLLVWELFALGRAFPVRREVVRR